MKREDKVEFARKIFYPKVSASLDSCNEKGVRLGTYEMSAVIKDQLDELVRRLDLSVDVSNYEPSETYRKATDSYKALKLIYDMNEDILDELK